MLSIIRPNVVNDFSLLNDRPYELLLKTFFVNLHFGNLVIFLLTCCLYNSSKQLNFLQHYNAPKAQDFQYHGRYYPTLLSCNQFLNCYDSLSATAYFKFSASLPLVRRTHELFAIQKNRETEHKPAKAELNSCLFFDKKFREIDLRNDWYLNW